MLLRYWGLLTATSIIAPCPSSFATRGSGSSSIPTKAAREAVHIHVRGEGGEAKFWLRPDVRVAGSVGFDARKLRELSGVVEDNAALIERAWNEYFA